MKKILLIAAACVGIALNVRAIPFLQLDASPALYDPSSETTISTANNFTLYAMVNSLTPSAGYTYALVAAIEPNQTTPATLGSFVLNGSTIHVTGDMTPGNPGLPPHGVYDTYYKEVVFNWSSATKFTDYDVSLVGGNHSGPTASLTGNSLYVSFTVDVSNLAPGHELWFDLAEFDSAGNLVGKAPFSHSAQSGGGGGGGNTVPDGGATAMLLGAAMLALGWVRRTLGR